jgi:alpha-glucosidase
MPQHLWWQRGVIYQVYPRSFMDGNGDGVGDLPGILGRLDYLTALGVDAIWISPIYPSPMADFGYDVADYTGIHPLFGGMADFDRLLAAAHERGLRVILDLVPNHTSDRHPWFLESRASRSSVKRDWYLWRDPAPDGGPPNNWLSVFGGPAWEHDPHTGQYYYHAFLKQQPDLNWRSPAVQQAMLDVMRFWLDRGVDGFRVDVMWHLIKDARFRDNPADPDFLPGVHSPYRALRPVYSTDQPEVHEIVGAMRRVMDGYAERVMIGEIYLPVDQLVTYYGREQLEAHMPFNFQLVVLPWDARRIAAAVAQYEASLPPGGWPNWVLGNHDKPRIATRVGAAQARVAAVLLLTLRGTPTMYYGDEIGMRDVAIPPDRVQDPYERNVPGRGRDPVRTPMQWDDTPGAGFTTGAPWLPLAEEHRLVNVARQQRDPASLLVLYRRLLALRRAEPALSVGEYRPLEAGRDLLAYVREHEGRRLLVGLNLGSHPETLPLAGVRGRIVLSTYLDRHAEPLGADLRLRADEGVVCELA